jgi:hypothetical protein
MTDIWSGIGVEISKADGEWLFRVGNETRGPVSQKVVVEKLLAGEIGPTTPVAKEGGDFHPIAQIKLFAQHVQQAKKLQVQRSARKVRRIVVLAVLLVAAGGSVAGYFVWQAHQKKLAALAVEKAAKLAELEAKRRDYQKVGDLGLVSLVTFGKEEDVVIKREPRRDAPGKRPGGSPDTDSPGKGGSVQMVSGCERSTPSILAALPAHASKLTVCVAEERKRPEGDLLPARLDITFVVRPDGKVVEFDILDRHYRTGLLKNCMTKVFNSVRYPTVGGSNCAVDILPITIGK